VNIKEEKQNCMWNLFACSIVVKVREWNCILKIYSCEWLKAYQLRGWIGSYFEVAYSIY